MAERSLGSGTTPSSAAPMQSSPTSAGAPPSMLPGQASVAAKVPTIPKAVWQDNEQCTPYTLHLDDVYSLLHARLMLPPLQECQGPQCLSCPGCAATLQGLRARAPACSSGRCGRRTGEWKARPRVSSSRTNTPSAFSCSSSGLMSASGPGREGSDKPVRNLRSLPDPATF